MSWWKRAACIGEPQDTFYLTKRVGRRGVDGYATPRAICASCPVRVECLEDALAGEQFAPRRYGFVGGMSPREREAEARRRDAA